MTGSVRAILVGVIVLGLAGWVVAQEPARLAAPSPTTTVYDPDPDHPFNLVHAALFLRVGPDGKIYGEDRLDPLLWAASTHLDEGEPGHDAALAALEALDRRMRDDPVADPLRRALLQRDLWLVTNWLAADEPERTSTLGLALAKAIRHVALTGEQIAALPDNYRLAVDSGRFAKAFDPARPEASYLPPGLLTDDGPWVGLGRFDVPVPNFHVDERGGNRSTNSVFMTRIKHPAGRAAGEAWIATIAASKEPLLLVDPADTSERRPQLPNPALPELPVGTEFALVRRALLIDTTGRVVASPLTESVQVRVTRQDARDFLAGVTDFSFGRGAVPVGGSRSSAARGFAGQSYLEFVLGRRALLAGEAGGLRDVSAVGDFHNGFRAHAADQFHLDTPSPFPHGLLEVARRRSCLECHYTPGVHGVQTIEPLYDWEELKAYVDEEGRQTLPSPRYNVRATTVGQEEAATVAWKVKQPATAALLTAVSTASP